MKGNGRLNAAQPPAQRASAWSTGRIGLDVEGHEPIVGVVELQRVLSLVNVIARFDTIDKAFQTSDLFPLVFSTIELWPELSIHPNPIEELGQRMTHYVLGHVQHELQQWDAKQKAVAEAMAELAAEGLPAPSTGVAPGSCGPERDEIGTSSLQEKPPEVS